MNTAYVPTVCWSRRRAWAHSWMPCWKTRPDADIMAFEKDLMTGKILGHLHPDQKVRVQGFEKIEKPFTDYFDLAISNIPFGDVAVFDPELYRKPRPGKAFRTEGNTQLLLPEKP